jgi:uncharacterized protein (DUF1697 family)
LSAYVAFLRGINVAGHNLVKMSDLRNGFESLGLARVSTYKASRNVIFESGSVPHAEYLEKKLGKALGIKAHILLRRIEEVRSLVSLNPFRDSKTDPPKFYVTFMAQEPQKKVKIPVFSQKGRCRIDP